MVLKLFEMAQQLLCQFHQTISHGLKIKFLENYGLESLLLGFMTFFFTCGHSQEVQIVKSTIY